MLGRRLWTLGELACVDSPAAMLCCCAACDRGLPPPVSGFALTEGETLAAGRLRKNTASAVRPIPGGWRSQAKAPIGSHAGSMVAGSSRAFWYSSGNRAFGTATS